MLGRKLRRGSLIDRSGRLARERSQARNMRASTDRRLTCDRCNQLCCAHDCNRTVAVCDLLTAQTCNSLLRRLESEEGTVDARGANLNTEQLHHEGAVKRQDFVDALAAQLVGNE